MTDFPDCTPKLGIFNPKRIDTLRPRAKVHIGKQFYFRYMWVITEEDGGPYVGQSAYEVMLSEDGYKHPEPYIGWVPTEDIDFLTEEK